jgi:hypothetical protein
LDAIMGRVVLGSDPGADHLLHNLHRQSTCRTSSAFHRLRHA